MSPKEDPKKNSAPPEEPKNAAPATPEAPEIDPTEAASAELQAKNERRQKYGYKVLECVKNGRRLYQPGEYARLSDLSKEQIAKLIADGVIE